MTALRTRVYAWTDHLPYVLNERIQIFHDDAQLNRENEHEGLLLDCRVGVKESDSEDDSS